MRAGLLVLLLAVAATATPAPQDQIAGEAAVPAALTLGDYRSALAALAAELERGEWESARALARPLRGSRVSGPGGSFEFDPTVLEAVESARDAAAAARARLRIGRLLATLGDGGTTAAAPDAALLERLAREQAARRAAAGGDVDASLDVPQPSLPEQVREWLDRAAAAAWELLVRLWRWLTRFGPRRERQGESGFTAPAVALLVGVILAVLAVFALRSLRSRGAVEEHGEAGEAVPRGDENPLSREAGEWERYAAELAAAGRLREAIRAWYHAVLVTLFRAGRLHHQQGRTNWEYVSQVGPEALWRPAFIELTRAFEREWYGRSQSAAEALRECARTAREVLRAVRGEATA